MPNGKGMTKSECRMTKKLVTAALDQPVVFLMSANPFPKESVFYELSRRSVMSSNPNGPVFAADLLEVKRGVKRIPLPETIILARPTRARLPAACSKLPRTQGCPRWGRSRFFLKHAFKWVAAPGLEILQGAAVHLIELSRRCVRLHLLVPFVIGQARIQLGHQFAVFLRRELGNGFLNFGDGGHEQTLQKRTGRGKSGDFVTMAGRPQIRKMTKSECRMTKE